MSNQAISWSILASGALAVSGVVVATTGCSTVAETGRSRLAVLPEETMNELGTTAYAEEISKYRVITGTREDQMVQRLGQRLAKASGRDYDWEFKLLDAPDVANAFALPGGKVAIYTGLLPITQNEDALAAVVGHEIAHVTAEHGNERMSQSYIKDAGLSGLQVALSNWGGASPQTREMIMGALAVGAEYGAMLPYSRLHESEADEIGLRYLVRAGYDPEAAPLLWERMAAASGERPPEFMSTHPDPLARAQALRDLIPKIVAEEKKQ